MNYIKNILFRLGKKILFNFNKKDLRNGLYVVNYHHISDCKFPKYYKIPSVYTEINIFKKHIQFYKKNFVILSLKEALKILKSNRSIMKRYLSIITDHGAIIFI